MPAYIIFHRADKYLKFFFISVVATDANGKTSAPHAFEMVLCTGCSQHGYCDFKQYREGTQQTDAIKYAKCICDGGDYPYWSG